MTSLDRIIRAKIKMMREYPFYAVILSYLRIKEKPEIPSAAVTQTGYMWYNDQFIKSLDSSSLQFVLAHEIMHLALGHLFRGDKKNMEIWNIAGDLVINDLLQRNGLHMHQEVGLLPTNGTMELYINGKKLKIVDIDKKAMEDIYNEIIRHVNKYPANKMKPGKGAKGFDQHVYNANAKGDTSKDASKEAEKWKDRFVQAVAAAKARGDLPAGFERLVDSILNNRVNWKRLLKRYITREIFTDYTWSRPHKRSRALGTYFPDVQKENVKIAVSVDTSGSISQQDLTQFLSEMVAIVRSTDNLKADIYVCDAGIHEKLSVSNGNIKKILDLKMTGGGGTSHIPVFEAVKNSDIKALICLTDGYTEFPEKNDFNFDTIWVLTKDSNDQIPFGKVIKMD